MEALWYSILALMLATYVVLDGFDLGAGIVHFFVARSDADRRKVFGAIGPVWDGNEVWLIASGGVLVFAFPKAYAVGFSGFYLPLMMVLWLLVGRGLSIEFRSRNDNPLWRAFWDAIFALSSAAIALVLGVALANVVRGVPIDSTGYFRGELFTDFRIGPRPGALDWYTLLLGLFALATLGTHGALYLNLKTSGEVQARSAHLALRSWTTTALLLVPATIATMRVAPVLFARLAVRPWAWPLPLVALGGLVLVPFALRRGREKAAFLSSGAFIAGILAATAAALYPDVLRSTLSEAYHLNAHRAATGSIALRLGLIWWLPALALAVGYFVYLFRLFRGKVSEGAGEYGH